MVPQSTPSQISHKAMRTFKTSQQELTIESFSRKKITFFLKQNFTEQIFEEINLIWFGLQKPSILEKIAYFEFLGAFKTYTSFNVFEIIGSHNDYFAIDITQMLSYQSAVQLLLDKKCDFVFWNFKKTKIF